MSIASEISRLQTAKADLKTAIEAKGVTVPSSATIDTYDYYVSQISGGGGLTRTVSGTPYCNRHNLYRDVVTEISIDGGASWVESGITQVLIESASTECIDYSYDYLTFVAETDNVRIGLYNASSNVFQYSLDYGSTWSNLSNNSTTPLINSGDTILFKASNLSISTETGIGILRPSASASVEGNVMSLIYGDNFTGQTTIPNNFQLRKLFSGATNLTSAENLVIPATTLKKQCYSQMFQGCTYLTTTPKTIGSSAMTWNGDYIMSDMFNNCTSLTTVSSSLLPALNLGSQCYWYMFEGCTSLTTAPILPATTLVSQCYQGMFHNCTSLNSVTCLLSSATTFTEFLTGVASTGTFYKNPSANWTSGSNGIPSTWTVQDYSS